AKMKAINMAAEPACSKARTTPAASEEVVTGDGGTLANVVVYVKSGLDGYSFPAPGAPAKIEQQGCQYHPHVIALQVGQNVDVVNADQTTHNIHPIPKDNREWNESQPPGAAPSSFTAPVTSPAVAGSTDFPAGALAGAAGASDVDSLFPPPHPASDKANAPSASV
ncbi:MAG TPA: hypothetical protein VNZ63_08165, partial [Verrucomicrobiae bacterium]|nr:hypothetical protein [Verrucomicrobiae bacterium]